MEFSKNKLVGKTVMSDQGIPIGIIKKSLRDEKTGNITSLLIEPSKVIDLKEYRKNNQGRIILPIENISPVKDVLIIEKGPINKEF